MRGKLALMVLVGGVLTSCATPPKPTQFEKSRTYALTKDQVWSNLLGYFTSNSIQIKTIEKASGVIYAERAVADPTMADCGSAPLSMEFGRPATLNVFVKPVDSGHTQVTVNASFEVVRNFENTTWKDQCLSTGVLERQILSSIAE